MRCGYSFVTCHKTAELLAVPSSHVLPDSYLEQVDCTALDRDGVERRVSIRRELISSDFGAEVFFTVFDGKMDVGDYFAHEDIEAAFNDAMRLFRDSTRAGRPCATGTAAPSLSTKSVHGISWCGFVEPVKDGACGEYLRKALGLS